jgi:four helix bundle protein
MATIKRFEEIEAWKTARELAKLIYKLTETERFAKDYGLKSQIQRAAVSVMSNIAEGFESRTQTQFINMLGHAKASAGEVRSQLYIALDIGYILQEEFNSAYELADKSARQIQRFINYLENQTVARILKEERAEYQIEE